MMFSTIPRLLGRHHSRPVTHHNLRRLQRVFLMNLMNAAYLPSHRLHSAAPLLFHLQEPMSVIRRRLLDLSKGLLRRQPVEVVVKGEGVEKRDGKMLLYIFFCFRVQLLLLDISLSLCFVSPSQFRYALSLPTPLLVLLLLCYD